VEADVELGAAAPPAAGQRANMAAYNNAAVERYYDTTLDLYEELWGEHVHHGFWDPGERPGGEADRHAATDRLVRELVDFGAFAPGSRVLDVGCGIGGPSRYLASKFGCRVTGLDLTQEFVALAGMLAQRTGLADKVSYRQGNALDMPFPDASFDLVWSQNAAMNIADRDRLYGEMRRVLTPSGRLALQDVAAGPGGEPYFPTPWASDKSISFLFTPQSTRAALERIGFRVLAWHDSTQEALEQQLARAKALEGGSLPPLGLHILIGEAYPAVTKNMLRNLQEQRIRLLNAVLERV